MALNEVTLLELILDNIRDYLDSILLARQEAESEGKHAEVSMLSDVHVLQIVSDIFFGRFEKEKKEEI